MSTNVTWDPLSRAPLLIEPSRKDFPDYNASPWSIPPDTNYAFMLSTDKLTAMDYWGLDGTTIRATVGLKIGTNVGTNVYWEVEVPSSPNFGGWSVNGVVIGVGVSEAIDCTTHPGQAIGSVGYVTLSGAVFNNGTIESNLGALWQASDLPATIGVGLTVNNNGFTVQFFKFDLMTSSMVPLGSSQTVVVDRAPHVSASDRIIYPKLGCGGNLAGVATANFSPVMPPQIPGNGTNRYLPYDSGSTAISGLVAYWPLDTNLNDVVGGHHLAPRNYGAIDPNTGPRSLSGSLYFRLNPHTSLPGPSSSFGVDRKEYPTRGTREQSLELYDTSNLAEFEFTLLAWASIRVTSSDPPMVICEQMDGAGVQGWSLAYGSGGIFRIHWYNIEATAAVPSMQTNTWYMVVARKQRGTGTSLGTISIVIFDGPNLRAGPSATIVAQSYPLSSDKDPFRLGVRNEDAPGNQQTQTFDGRIADVAIWREFHSDQFLENLYRTRRPVTPYTR